MNPKLIELFDIYKNLRSVQTIVEEIYIADHYVYNFVEDEAIDVIDQMITKYKREIKKIGTLYKNKVVIENDPQVYEKKDDVEINDDIAFIRDCLVIIGAVKSGIRSSLEEVVYEIEEFE